MNNKFDAALNIELKDKDSEKFNVSVRLNKKCSQEDLTILHTLGIFTANQKHRIFFAQIDRDELHKINELEFVSSISLVKTLLPK